MTDSSSSWERLIVVVALAGPLAFSVPSSATPITFEFTKIAETGDVVPSLGGTFAQLRRPALSGDRTIFYGLSSSTFPAGTGSRHHHGIFEFRDGQLSPIVHTQTPLPGSTEVFTNIDDNGYSISGDNAAFRGNNAIFVHNQNGFARVAPLDTGPSFQFVQYPSIDGNNVSFTANRGSAAPPSIWADRGQGLEVIADRNTPVPLPLTEYASNRGTSKIGGQNVAFIASDSEERLAVLLDRNGNLEVVARPGTPVPDSTDVFQDFGGIVDISGDRVLFSGTSEASWQSGLTTHRGVYVYEDGDIDTVVDTNSNIPGTEAKFQVLGIASIDGTDIAFRGHDGSAVQIGGINVNPGGIYAKFDNEVVPVMEIGDGFDGRVVASVNLGNISDRSIGFNASLYDRGTNSFSTAVIRAEPKGVEVPEPPAPPQPQPEISSLTFSSPTAGEIGGSVEDASAPTIVLTHGFQPGGAFPDWVLETRDAIRTDFPEANVLTWVWKDAFQPLVTDLLEAKAQAKSQGEALANALTENGVQQVHFVGHSLGTHVNAYAAQKLISDGHPVNQVTILDRPFGTVPAFEPAELELFRTALDGVNWVDNYFGNDRVGFPGKTAAVGNPIPGAYNMELQGRDHGGVHDYYITTVEETALRRKLELPGGQGFYWSEVGGGFSQRPDPRLWDPGKISKITRLEQFTTGFWNTVGGVTTDFVAELLEQSPAYLWADYEIPVDADILSFDFEWLNVGDGDFLTLHFGEDLLFNFLGTVNEDIGSLISSGPISISQYAGQTRQLLFTLNSVGVANANVRIENLSIVTLDNTTVPEPSAVWLLVIGLVGLRIVRTWQN